MQTLDLALVESPSTTSIGWPASPLDSTGLGLTTATNGSSLLFPPPAAAAAATSGVANAPRDKCLPPIPLLAFGAEGTSSSSPSPTPPVTPFLIPLAKAPVDLCPALRETTDDAPSPSAAQAPGELFLAFRDTAGATMPTPTKEQGDVFSAFRDTTETPTTPPLTKEQSDLFFAFRDTTETPTSPPPTKAQAELHLAFRDHTMDPPSPSPAKLPAELHSAFRDMTDETPPPDTPPSLPQPGWQQQQRQRPELPPKPVSPKPFALLDGADSSQRVKDFNPFGRPGSFVISESPAGEPSSPGTVRNSDPLKRSLTRSKVPLPAPI